MIYVSVRPECLSEYLNEFGGETLPPAMVLASSLHPNSPKPAIEFKISNQTDVEPCAGE